MFDSCAWKSQIFPWPFDNSASCFQFSFSISKLPIMPGAHEKKKLENCFSELPFAEPGSYFFGHLSAKSPQRPRPTEMHVCFKTSVPPPQWPAPHSTQNDRRVTTKRCKKQHTILRSAVRLRVKSAIRLLVGVWFSRGNKQLHAFENGGPSEIEKDEFFFNFVFFFHQKMDQK